MTALMKRSNISLYSKETCPYSHRVRLVLAEKGATYDLLDIDRMLKTKEEMLELNPYGTTPTLLDRELVLYQSEIIMEYLDERFPHPPLMPVYPVARSRSRLMMYRINRDWYSCMDKILQELTGEKSSTVLQTARKTLLEGLVSIAPIFVEMPYFLSTDFSLVDCCMAPLLWRLPSLGITLPVQAKSMIDYADRLFEREHFLASLTDTERALRS